MQHQKLLVMMLHFPKITVNIVLQVRLKSSVLQVLSCNLVLLSSHLPITGHKLTM